MTTVHENIPEELRADVEAALAWFNESEDVDFEVTGILDPNQALTTSGAREIRLVLCGGDRCEQRSFRVSASGDDFHVTLLEESDAAAPDGPTPAELDPPPGARRAWLDRALAAHAFVLLVFYRGFW